MLQSIFFISIFLLVIAGITSKKRLLMCILLINIISDSISLYSEYFIIKTGIIRLLACLIISLYYRKYLVNNKYFFYIILIALYYSLLAFVNSTDFMYSLISVLKFLTPFIFYPLTIEALKHQKSKNFYFENSILISIFYIGIVLLISQIFKLGSSPYIDDFFYLGGMNIQVTYTLAYSVIFLLYINSLKTHNSFSKKTSIIAIIISCLLIILIFRRVAILSILLGFIFYFISHSKINPLKLLFTAGLISLSISLFITSKYDFTNLIELRQKNSLTEEGRYLELLLINEDMRKNGLLNIIFGNELFNSKNYFKKNNIYRMENQEQLHTDFATLLHGSGISGLMIFAIFFISIIKHACRNSKAKDLFFPIAPLILTYLLFSISGQYYIFTSLTFFCIFLAFYRNFNFNKK